MPTYTRDPDFEAKVLPALSEAFSNAVPAWSVQDLTIVSPHGLKWEFLGQDDGKPLVPLFGKLLKDRNRRRLVWTNGLCVDVDWDGSNLLEAAVSLWHRISHWTNHNCAEEVCPHV